MKRILGLFAVCSHYRGSRLASMDSNGVTHPGGTKDKVPLADAHQPAFGLIYIARAAGYLDQESLDVEISSHPSVDRPHFRFGTKKQVPNGRLTSHGDDFGTI